MNIRSIAVLVAALALGAHAQIVVAAAANVKPAMDEIIPIFQKTTGTAVRSTLSRPTWKSWIRSEKARVESEAAR